MKNLSKLLLSTLFVGGISLTANAVEVVETYDLDYTGTINSDYVPGYAEFDEAAVLEALGLESLDAAEVVSLDKKGEVLEQTSNNGYWFNYDGEVTTWGNDSAWFVEYEEGNAWNIGNFPGLSPMEGSCTIGFSNGNEAVMFEISLEFVAEDLGGINIVKTYDVKYAGLSQADYAAGTLAFDASEVLSLLGLESLDDARIVSLDELGEVLSQTGNNGYWYNYDGEVCNWGADAVWFIEYHGEDVWEIGNYPGVDEAHGICNIGFYYEGKIVLFYIDVTIEPASEPEPMVVEQVVATEEMECQQEASAEDYEPTLYYFYADEVTKALGCSSIYDAKVISLNQYGDVLDQTANNGYWYNKNGEVCGWGEDAAWFIEYGGENIWSIGNFPGVNNVSAVSNIGFYYEGKAYMFEIKVTIGTVEINVLNTIKLSYEQTAEGEASEGVIPFTESDVTLPLGESLENLQVVSLSKNNEILPQTANNGYWYNSNGEVCNWGDEDMAFWIEYHGEGSEFTIGFNGQDVDAACNIGFMSDNYVVMFQVNVQLTVEPISGVDIVKTYSLEYSAPANDSYEAGTCQFNEEEVLSLLGCQSLDQASVISLDTDGEVLSQTANNGYWYDANGEVCVWGEDAAWFIEYNGEGRFNIGNYPSVTTANGLSNIGFYYNGKAVMFEVSVNIGDVVSGVKVLNTNEELNVYNLQGVKLNVKDLNNLNSGIYIINGKKVIIKNN